MAIEETVQVALVFTLHGTPEHPLPDAMEWSRDIDNIVDFLLDDERTDITEEVYDGPAGFGAVIHVGS